MSVTLNALCTSFTTQLVHDFVCAKFNISFGDTTGNNSGMFVCLATRVGTKLPDEHFSTHIIYMYVGRIFDSRLFH